MATEYHDFILASTYGSNPYNSFNYNGTNTTTTANGGSAGGGLTNTGIAVAGIVTIAAVILLVATVVRIWRRPSRKAQPVPAESDDSTDQMSVNQ